MALLREATGLDDVEAERRPQPGATVMLDTAIRAKSTQRISLQQDGDAIALVTFPAELKPQAQACTGPAGPSGSSTSWQRIPGSGRPARTSTSRSATPLPPDGSTCTVTWTSLSTSTAGRATTSAMSASTTGTASGTTSGCGSGSASTPVPRMTTSSTHSSTASVTAPPTCDPASRCSASGPGPMRSASTSAARWPTKYVLRSLSC